MMAVSLNTSAQQPQSGPPRGRWIFRLLRDRRRRWQITLPLVLVLSLGAAAAYYFGVFAPAQTAQAPQLQTTVARRGNIVISAAGTGTLQAANQAELAFKSAGTVSSLKVKVGDHVTRGQLLAELDNATQKLELEQAQQNLDGLRSTTAIGNAQQALSAAMQKLQSAEFQLEYLISPDVYYWENQVSDDEAAVKKAQKAADAAPNDLSAQAALKKAQDVLGFAQDKLKEAQKAYHDYVLDTFTTTRVDPQTGQSETTIEYPTPEEITKARQDITIDRGAVEDDRNLYNALTGGHVTANASGAGLLALSQAQQALKTAQQNFDSTEITAPFDGTIIAVPGQVGPISAVPTPSGSLSASPVKSTSVITIADLGSLFVQTYVDESDYADFQVGNTANVVFDALPDKTYTGRVTQVDPQLSTSSGTAVVSGLVKLDQPDATLLLGMTASVDVIAAEAQNVVLVPVAALHEYSPGKYAVFVVRNGQLTPQLVEVGLQDLVNAEIKSGLQPGDVVSTGLLAGQ